LSLYLLIATLVLAAATFAVVAVVAIRQHRLNQAAAQRNDDDSVSTDRIVKLVESVAAVLRALEERTRELETGLRELGAERTAQGEKLAAIAASLEQVRTDQAEADRRLEGALASTVEEFGKHQGALVDNLLPNIARRDERLVAIDANITATADRLAKLGADTERNARETAVLAECFGSLETSMSELTSGLVELRGAPQGGREGRPEEPAGPQDSDTSDASMGSSEEPTTDSEESSPSTASREAPTD